MVEAGKHGEVTWRFYGWYGCSMRGGSIVIVSNGMMLWVITYYYSFYRCLRDEKQGAVWLNKFKHKAQLGAINCYRNIS